MAHGAWTRGARAFTLVEAVIVLLIVGVLAAIAAPRFGHSLRRYRAEATARRILTDLQLAQRHARSTSTSQSVQFATAQNRYTLAGLPALDRSSGEYEVRLSGEPYEAALVAADFGGDELVTFNGYGLPDTCGSVLIQVGDEYRLIVLNGSGAITISESKVLPVEPGLEEPKLPEEPDDPKIDLPPEIVLPPIDLSDE